MHRSLSVVLFIALLWGIGATAAWGQHSGLIDPVSEVTPHPDEMLPTSDGLTELVYRGGEAEIDTSSLGASPFEGGDRAERKARRAAWMDSGILMYVEPPEGTNMPTISPPENVDPEMVHPVRPESTATIEGTMD